MHLIAEASAVMLTGSTSRDALPPEPLGKVWHLLLWLLPRPVRKGIIVRDLLTLQSKPL